MDIDVSSLLGQKWTHFMGGVSYQPRNSRWTPLFSPATGAQIAEVAAGDTSVVNRAVGIAQSAFESWSKRPAYDREKIIRQATTLVRTQADRIGLLMALEQGKPFPQSRSEILAACDTIDYYASEAVRVEGYINPTEKTNMRSWVIYQPVGVCGVITPWNYPVSLLSWKLGPALATGCTMVVKPTSITPMSPLAFCKALTEGGIPPGVINVILGGGQEVGEPLVLHPLVKKVAMTGSTETGKRIMTKAASSLKKISLELGGQCPAIVCADAELDNAAQVIAYKGFRNDGQSCSSVNRVYVHTSVADPFLNKLKQYAESLTIGDGVWNREVDLGPMCTQNGLETVKKHVSDALSKGAHIVTGGESPTGEIFEKGRYYRPTILTDVTDLMLVMVEETFGPLVPVQTFEDLAEAVRKANHTPYGLVSYLFTRDLRTTIEVSEMLEAGTIAVNCSAVNTNYGPYAGWKESGYGLELSRRAVMEYLRVKHIKMELT